MFSFLFDQRPSSHFIFGLHEDCSTFIEVWFCRLRPLDVEIYLVAFEGHVFGPSVYETTTWPHKN
jgi:hypothetical protein